MGRIAKIRNENQDRAFDLIREPDALYLSIKCSDNGHSKFVRIKVSDVLYQIWRKMSSLEKKKACHYINDLITTDKKSA